MTFKFVYGKLTKRIRSIDRNLKTHRLLNTEVVRYFTDLDFDVASWFVSCSWFRDVVNWQPVGDLHGLVEGLAQWLAR